MGNSSISGVLHFGGQDPFQLMSCSRYCLKHRRKQYSSGLMDSFRAGLRAVSAYFHVITSVPYTRDEKSNDVHVCMIFFFWFFFVGNNSILTEDQFPILVL